MNILIVGVGGQGTLLSSKIIGNAALMCGMDAKVSEVHGMSQRGGSVITYAKLGKDVASPLVENNEGDFLIAFELLEAYRWSHFLKKDGLMIVNSRKIEPMPVITGQAEYPENIEEKLKEKFKNHIFLDCFKIAQECGSAKAVNVVLLGIFAKKSGIPMDIWEKSLVECIKPEFLKINQKAFHAAVV